ncbi:hypothetical protein ACIQC5_11525 [Paenarthrobacter sp. NPDC092416]|uniref:hypothetical protein n=1 Tax=Paenarthrobacter sp. NPDC092416 TaxID=3364386 RepID=UPI0037FC5D05
MDFDDAAAADWIQPGLTTVTQMAATAMRALPAHLDGYELLPRRIDLRTQLVVRGSTTVVWRQTSTNDMPMND